jgi:hypothetical protein
MILGSIASLSFALACLALPGTASAGDGAPPVNAVAAVTPTAPSLPYGVNEVIKMFQGGISKDIILGYVQNTALPFHLTADGIIYLQHIGIPQDVISALIHRDGQLHDQAAQAYQQSMAMQQMQQQQGAYAGQPQGAPGPDSAVAGGGNAVVTPTTPPPPVYDEGGYADYSGYPYDYGSYYWPPVVVGGWGPGWGWGGWGHGWGRGFGGFGHGGFGGGFGHGGFGGGGFGHGGFGGGGAHGGFGGGGHGGGGGHR